MIAGVKQNLEPIENLRNCIAHNRSFSDIVIDNYNEAQENLGNVISDFWERIQKDKKE